jgi:hypothetical protein
MFSTQSEQFAVQGHHHREADEWQPVLTGRPFPRTSDGEEHPVTVRRVPPKGRRQPSDLNRRSALWGE